MSSLYLIKKINRKGLFMTSAILEISHNFFFCFKLSRASYCLKLLQLNDPLHIYMCPCSIFVEGAYNMIMFTHFQIFVEFERTKSEVGWFSIRPFLQPTYFQRKKNQFETKNIINYYKLIS